MKNRENAKYIKLGITGAAVVAFGLALFFLMFRADGLSGTVRMLMNILRPFVYGAVIAYLVTPLCRRLERLFSGWFRGKRDSLASTLAILLSLLVVVVVVLAIVLLIVPQLVNSIVEIVSELPGQIEALQARIRKLLEDHPELQAQWEPLAAELRESLGGLSIKKVASSKLTARIMSLATGAANQVVGVVGVLRDLMLGVIVSTYLLSRRRQLAAQAALVVRGAMKPAWADWIEREVHYADRMFNGFFMGKLLDSAIIGGICFLGCLIMGFDSPLLIAVIVGVTNIIPFFGPIIGGVPSALLLLLEDPMHCLMFIVFIVLLQQLDGNVIGPRILGESTGLSAMWVMFAILLFGGLWGIAGMLVGVPLMAVIYDIIRQLTYRGVRKNGYEDMIARYNARFHPAVTPGPKKKDAA